MPSEVRLTSCGHLGCIESPPDCGLPLLSASVNVSLSLFSCLSMSRKRSGGHWRAVSGSGLSLGSRDANEPGDLEDDGWYILIVGGLSECYSVCLSIYLACLCYHTATD